MLSTPAPTLADCGYGPGWPSLADARGETFSGTFRGITQDEFQQDVLHWDVDHVYAGDVETGRLDGWGTGRPSCHNLHFRAGAHYLVSANDDNRDAYGTLAYRIHPDGRFSLVAFQGTTDSFPARYRVHSLAAAVALLAPQALPATDIATMSVSGGSGLDLQLPLLALSFCLGAGAWIIRATRARRIV